jgi:hypothetical protein
MARTAEIVFMALCLPVLGACADGTTGSARPQAQSAATGGAPRSESSHAHEHEPPLTGTWDHAFGRADRQAILENFAGLVDNADRVVARLAFVDEDDWWLGFLFDGELLLLDGVPEGDGGTYTLRGDQLATTGAHGATVVTYDWVLEGRTLTLTAVEECEVVAGNKTGCTRNKADMDPMMRLITENTFTRSGSDAGY